MKTPYTHKIILALVALILPMLTHAQVSLTGNDAAGTSSFNTAGHWSDNLAPSAGKDYSVTNLLRTPGDANNYTFAGHSITMGIPASYANGTLIYKGSGATNQYIINNLTNAGGLIRSGAGSGNIMFLGGNMMNVTANSTIEPDQSPFVLNMPLIGGDGVVLTNLPGGTVYPVTYGGTNSAFTGTWFLAPNALVIFTNVNSFPGNPSTLNPSQIAMSAGSQIQDPVGLILTNSNSGITLLGSATINSSTTTIIGVPIAIYTNLSTLTKNGAGILILSNAFNVWSNTTISAGTLRLGVANALPPHNVTDNGTLDLNGFSTTIDGIAGSGTVDTISGGTPTLTIGITGGLGTFTGAIKNTAGTLSLTKVGGGAETLNGGYTYGGTTLVAGGTLSLSTAFPVPSPAGNLAISNGATLTVNATNGTALPANIVTFGTNTTLNLSVIGAANGINAAGGLTFQDNATNNFIYGNVTNNPTVAPINTAGSISAPGANIVMNLSAFGLKPSQFPLIKYGTGVLASTANFSVGSVPPGVVATLVNDNGNHSIDFNIISAPNILTWNGVNGTSWDTTTANWTNAFDGTITVYQEYAGGAGDVVNFDDTLTNSNPQPTNINLTAVFHAFPVTVNSTRPYTIAGAGGLAGSSGTTGFNYFTKNNTGSLTLLTSNSFTGGFMINGGSVIITNDFSLGANSSVVILNGGTLQVNGNTTNNARTFSVRATSTMDVSNSVTAQFGGAITGAGGLTKTDDGTLVLAGSNTITGTLTVNQGTLTTLGTNVLAAVPIIGNTLGFNGLLNIAGGLFQANNNGGSVSSSSLTIGNVVGSAGDVVMTGGAVTVNRQLTVGPTDYGAFSQSGGTTTIGGFIACGGSTAGGVFNQSGGTVGMNGSSATIGYSATNTFGVMNLSGNAVFNMIGSGNGVWPGEVGNGTLNVSGSAALTITNSGLSLGGVNGQALAVGAVNLNGGTATVNFVTKGAGTGMLNFNGGTLKANVTTNAFVSRLNSANVYSGGATIDDGGFAITIPQPLLSVTNGYGIASIPVDLSSAYISAGYIDTPIVTISDLSGNGSNAMATAQVDPVTGAVTNIIITCPGSGFVPSSSGPNLDVTFYGGGSLANPNFIPVTTGTPTFVANGKGGLTKNGSGTTTLTGVNTFAGPITNNAGTLSLNSASTYAGAVNVNGGTLSISTAGTITGPTTVSNGASFGITQIGSATATIGALTFNGAAAVPGGSLVLALSSANNTAVPVLNCSTLTFNGTNTISLAGAVNVGTNALVHYSSLLGSGNLTNLTLPQGAAGFISNSVASSTIYAIITSTGPGIVWSGTNSNAALTNLWDLTGTTTNWLLGATPTAYHQSVIPGDAVTFDDTGNGLVILNANAGPASLVITNNSKNYTFKGRGQITGSTGLQKLGSGTAFLNLTNNSYTGDTVISNGTLQVGNPTALSSSANLNVGPSGILELNGLGQAAGSAAPSTSVAGLSGSGIIDNNSGVNVLLIVGSGSGGIWNGSIQDHGNAGVSLTKLGNNTLVITGTNRLADGTLTGYSSVDQGTMIITNGGVLSIPFAQFYVGSVAGSSGTNIVAGGTLVVSNNLLAVGRGSATANGTLIVNSGTVQKAGANNMAVGSTGGTGTLIVNGGQVLNNSELYLGDGANSGAALYLNGGLLQAADIRPINSPNTIGTAYFNGGTLQASTNSTSFLQVQCEVMGGGLVLDDNGHTLSIGGAALQNGGGGGGLLKNGSGTVYLDIANSYTGNTVVSNGTLAGIGSVAGSVTVLSGGNLGAGDAATNGIFTISGNLMLQGNTTLRINKTLGVKTNDQVAVTGSITYGGVLNVVNITGDGTPLVIGDTFQVFNKGGSQNFTSVAGSGATYSFDNTTGLLTVTGLGPGTFSNKTGITGISLNGANIVLTATNGQAGDAYYLLESTNVGLPLSQWVPVATNVLGASGNYTFTGTNVVTTNGQHQFYILSNTNN